MVAHSPPTTRVRNREASTVSVRKAPLGLRLSALLVAIIMLAPPVYLAIRASEAGSGTFDLLTRARNLEVLRNSLLLAGSVGLGSAAIGVPFAWLLERTDLPGRRFFSIVSPLPLAIPSYVGALTFIEFLGPRGNLQQFLSRHAGIESIPSIYGFWGSFLAITLFTYPYVLLQARASLQRLDPSLDDAARSLGHSSWRTFRRSTLPVLRPSILAGSLLAALYAISDFGVVTLLRYDTFTRAIYTQYRASLNRSNAAVLALMLIVVAGLIVSTEMSLRGRAIYHRVGSGASRRAPEAKLGYWTYPALLAFGGIIVLSLGLPVAVILSWLIDRQGQVESTSRLLWALWHSVQLGALVGVIALTFALPVALFSVRYRGRLASVIERICYLGFGLPGIVIALTFVFFGIRIATPLYQTLWLMSIALAIRFLPQALAAERSALLLISPRVEEASRSLGRGAGFTFAHVTLPLTRSGFVVGWALVFVSVIKELPITLLLSPIEYRTLATEVWTSSDGGAYSNAAVPALVLVAVASIPTLFFRPSVRPSDSESHDSASAAN